MAITDAPALPLTLLYDVKTFETDAPREDIEKFLRTLPGAISGEGKLYSQNQIFLPNCNNTNLRKIYPTDDPDKLTDRNESAELYYSDVVQLLSDTIRWLQANGNDKTLETLGDTFSYLDRNKYGILIKWGSFPSESNEATVSEAEIQKHKAEIPELLNWILYVASFEFKDLVAVQEDKPEEEDLPVAAEEPAAAKVKPKEKAEEEQPDQEGGVPEVRDIPRTEEDIEHRQKIQYEATWIYNRALHDFFITHGIDYAFIESNPEVRDLLLSETIKLLENRSDRELKLLFANPSRRLEILRELYLNLSRSPQFTAGLQNLYDSYLQTLPDNLRQEFTESFQKTSSLLENIQDIRLVSDDYKFRQDLSEILGTDSPTLIGVGSPEFTRVLGSVQVAVDALILNQGTNFAVINLESPGQYAADQAGTEIHNAIWLIEKMSDEHLLLMLGIPTNISLDQDAIRRLRQVILNYARMRAVYLALNNQNLSSAEGINPLNNTDAEAIAARDEATIRRALLTPHQATSEMVKEYGTEVSSKALSKSVKSQRAKEFVQWNLLSQQEKELIVYQYLGFTEKDVIDFHQPPDRVHLFNLQALMLEAQMMAASQEERARQLLAMQILENEALRIFAYEQEENIRAEALRQYILAEYADYDLPLEQRDASVLEVVNADGGARADDLDRKLSFRDRLTNRFTKRFGGERAINPKQKLLGAIKKSGLSKIASQQAAEKLGLIIGGPLGAAAAKALTGKHKKWVWGGVAGVTGLVIKGLMKMLQSATAFVSGLAGGTLVGGGLLALGLTGPVGAIIFGVGAAGLFGLGGYHLFGGAGESGLMESAGNMISGKPAAAPSSLTQPQPPESLGTSSGAGATTATTASTVSWTSLSGLSMGILAPALTIFLIAFTAMMVIFIIQGSFLITLPESLSSRTYRSNLSGFEGCWPTTGVILSYRTYMGGGGGAHAVTSSYHGYTGPGIALDIATGSNSTGEGGVTPPIYAPFSGIGTFYPEGTGIYCGSCAKKYPYGNYMVIDTGEFLLLFAHMLQFPSPSIQYPIAGTNQTTSISMTSVTENIQIDAGVLIGTVDSTGNSTGNHLHYEVIGGGVDIIDIVPLTDSERDEINDNERAIYGMRVNSQECASTNIDRETGTEGYIAIGPQNPDNLVISPSSMFQQPTHPCTWFDQNQNLAVATNANFYNSSSVPIGPAGSAPARYLANANGRDPEYMEETMRYLGVATNNQIEFGPVPEAWYSSDMPFNIETLTKAITGVSSSHPEDGELRNRIAIGMGNVDGQCSDFTGPAFLVGGMRSTTYEDLAEMMTACGAEEFMFLDGGNSASFCSEDYTITGTRNMPVNVGLIQADVEAYSSNESDDEEVIVPPPGDGQQPI